MDIAADVGPPWNVLLGFGVRFLLAAFFVVVSVSKLKSRSLFATSIADYQLLPGRWVPVATLAVPISELAIGIGLALAATYQIAALFGLGLILVFTGAQLTALRRGLQIGCGCRISGNRPQDEISWRSVARNVALILLLAGLTTTDVSAVRALDGFLALLTMIGVLLAIYGVLYALKHAGQAGFTPRSQR